MTISSSTRTAGPFLGDGSTTALPFGFKVFATTDVLVQRTSADGAQLALTLGGDYTVALNADQNAAPGGVVTLLDPAADFPTGSSITLTSAVAATQPLSLANGGPFLAKSIEDALDRLTLLLQQQALSLDGAIRAPLVETLTELPAATTRRGKMMAFNASSGDLELTSFTQTQVALAVGAAYSAGSIGLGLNVLDYGASTSATAAVNTAAFQTALDLAGNVSAIRRVFVPAGAYLLNTIYIPAAVVLEGETISETTARIGTQLVQGSEGDVIRFIPHSTTGKQYWFGAIRRLAVFGDKSFASGWGISFRDSDGDWVAMQDLACLEDLIVRRCPSGGIEIPNSGLPITLQRIKLLFNNGPGIHMTSVTTHQHQGVTFNDISGDGNNGGLIKLSGLDRSGSVNIFNLKSESRVNADYGSVPLQQNAIVLNGCNGTPINIFGVTHICSVPDGANFVKPGSVIKLLDSNFPEINWSGVSVRVRPGDTGPDPSIVEYASTVAIPYTTTSGRFGNSNFSHVTQANGYKQTFGPISSYQAEGPEDTAMQVAGTTPAFSLYETDASADAKAWILAASGGEFTLRAINDDGSVGQIIWTATRTSMHIGPDAAGTYLRINGTETPSATAGAASALPAAPVGYIAVNINGVGAKIPYYS